MKPPVEIVLPLYVQVLGAANVWFIKPTYMLMAAYILKRLWRYRKQPEIWWLWSGLFAFQFGEAACAVNYVGFAMKSVFWEMLHNAGMAVSIGFLNMAVLEIIDRRMIFQFVEGKACALMRFCKSCPVKEDMSCRFRPIFMLICLGLAFVFLIPLTKGFIVHPIKTTVFGYEYVWDHLLQYQYFENRVCPVIGIALSLITFFMLHLELNKDLFWERVLFSFAIAFGTFGLIRFANYRINWDYPIWFDFWEESLEWITIFGLGLGLYIFREQLFDEPTDEAING